jgi:dTDP-4-amino-4,6-dideoxy-D-galactose acyltransferase
VANKIFKLDWDSKFFGFPMGRIYAENLTGAHLGKALKNAGKAKLKFIELFCNISDNVSIFSCENQGFHLADIRIVFEKHLVVEREISRLPENLYFRKASRADINQLKRMSKGLFRDSRFYQYKKFDSNIVDSLFQSWIEKAVLGEFDDECYCIFDDTEILTFCSLKYSNNAASIGLFGVNPGHKNKGLGSMMLECVFHLLFNREVNRVNCITQGRNSGAVRLYQKSGFSTGEITLCYYRWLE